MDKEATSHRLSKECKRLLKLLADRFGVTQTAIIELSVREKAKREGIEDDPHKHTPMQTE